LIEEPFLNPFILFDLKTLVFRARPVPPYGSQRYLAMSEFGYLLIVICYLVELVSVFPNN
jgi:hypothetical protein